MKDCSKTTLNSLKNHDETIIENRIITDDAYKTVVSTIFCLGLDIIHADIKKLPFKIIRLSIKTNNEYKNTVIYRSKNVFKSHKSSIERAVYKRYDSDMDDYYFTRIISMCRYNINKYLFSRKSKNNKLYIYLKYDDIYRISKLTTGLQRENHGKDNIL